MQGKSRFLLVDDQEEINLLMEHILSPYGTCVVVNNGPDAVELFSRAIDEDNPFHAVFLDIMMPGMDGHEVANNLRKAEEGKSGVVAPVKLMMITALTDTSSVCKSFFRGGKADAYITKPINKDKLLEELKILKLIDM